MRYALKPVIPVFLVALIASPLAAQEQMTRTKCQEAFTRLMTLTNQSGPEVGLQTEFVRINPDSWCQFRRSDPGFAHLPFEQIDWRLQDSALWTDQGIPPMAVQIRITGFDVEMPEGSGSSAVPPLDIEATLRQVPDAGVVVLERVEMSNNAGDILSVSGVFERVFLSSPSMMQVSLGSATFKAGLMSMTLDGIHENPFGFYGNVYMNGTPQTQSGAAFDAISNLPAGLMDDATRAELTAFAADLPRPIGTLEVSAASERGLGLMQIGSAMYSGFTSVMDGDTISNEIEIMFDGLTIEADWSPAAQVAD